MKGKLERVINSSPGGLLEFDLKENKVTSISPKLLEIVGYSRKELIDETKFYIVIHPEDFQNFIELREDQDLKFRIITKEGEIKWLMGKKLLILNHKGEINILRYLLLDATEKKISTRIKEDISNLIKTCVKRLSGYVKSKNISINMNIQDNLITEIEKEKLYLVICNLLINAIKYTPYGVLSIKSKIEDNFIIVSIQDTGIGLTEKEKEQIFTKYGKLDHFSKEWDVGTEGSGLGFFICKKIVELHGGQIWVESEGRNKRSTFCFSLPLSTTNCNQSNY